MRFTEVSGMDEEKTTQEQEAEGAAAAEAGAETAETVAEAEKTTTGTVTDDAGDPEPAEKNGRRRGRPYTGWRRRGSRASWTRRGVSGRPRRMCGWIFAPPWATQQERRRMHGAMSGAYSSSK